MISDFVYLTRAEQKDNHHIFKCGLPDVNNEDDDVMIECGKIDLDFVINGVSNINISLYSNFDSLCIGDYYDRKIFVDTVVFLLKQEMMCNFTFYECVISDSKGSFIFSDCDDL